MAFAKTRVQAIIDEITSDAMTSGHFVGVFGAEAMAAPSISNSELTVAVWVDTFSAVSERSGLNTMSMRLGMAVRVYGAAMVDRRDDIDPSMMAAVSELIGLYVTGFTLGGQVANVDLKGAHGNPIGAESGHLTIDRKIFRVYDIAFGLIVDDLWTEAP